MVIGIFIAVVTVQPGDVWCIFYNYGVISTLCRCARLRAAPLALSPAPNAISY